MRRVVGSCLGAHWRLLVMPVQPRRQSVCFSQAWRVFQPQRVCTSQRLLLFRCSQMHPHPCRIHPQLTVYYVDFYIILRLWGDAGLLV